MEIYWIFCSPCYAAIKRNNIPKFSVKDSVNVTMCQHYQSELEDLTPVEECLDPLDFGFFSRVPKSREGSPSQNSHLRL